MDISSSTHFTKAFSNVMSQFGFGELQNSNLTVIQENPVSSGIIVIVGIVGAKKGNAVYTINIEDAKKIASAMMMGMPVAEIDEMAKSALSELTNMLAAHMATSFSEAGVLIDISTPTLFHGDNISLKMNHNTVHRLQLEIGGVSMVIFFAFEK